MSLTDRPQRLFENEKSFTRRKIVAAVRYNVLRHRHRSSFCRRETQTEKNEKRAGCSIEPLRDRFIRPQSFAERGREPRQNEAPDRARGDKGEPERDERRDFRV